GAGIELRAPLEGPIGHGAGDVLRHDVGRDLERAAGADAGDALEPAELRGEAVAGRDELRPGDALAVALDVAPDAEAERVAGRVRVAELRERDAELGGPAERVDRRGDVPYAVPRRVLLVVVVDRVIALHAVRVDGELEAGAPVVVGVDDDLDLVRRPAHVAARERAHDAV